MSDHTTADDASRYRPADELEAARKLEPLLRFRAYLGNEQNWSEADDEALYTACRGEIDRAIQAYRDFPEQKPGEFFDHMYAAPTADLEAQKKEWLTEVKRHG